jgi:DNA helicase HerA-like ATPase
VIQTTGIGNFIDEAHLIFNEASKALLEQIETIKLIRSKGIGIYFVTQNPMDVPVVYWHN